jgi:MFS transporter, DHA2 family, multidrug resistance protein
VIFGVSFLAFSIRGGTIEYREIIIATVVGRIGLGLILPALSLATLRHVPPQELGQSSVVFSYARQLGGVMGVAILAVFIEWQETIFGATPPGVFTAYSRGFVLLAAVFCGAVIATLFMKAERPSPNHGPA